MYDLENWKLQKQIFQVHPKKPIIEPENNAFQKESPFQTSPLSGKP